MDYSVWGEDNMYLIWLSAVSRTVAHVQVFDINIQVPSVGKYWVTCEQVGRPVAGGNIWVWDVCPTRECHQRVSDWTSWYIYDDCGKDVSSRYGRLAYFTYPRSRLVGWEQLCNHDWKDQSKQFAVIDDGEVISTRYQPSDIAPNSLLNMSW